MISSGFTLKLSDKEKKITRICKFAAVFDIIHGIEEHIQ